jgi:hypothetical protein
VANRAGDGLAAQRGIETGIGAQDRLVRRAIAYRCSDPLDLVLEGRMAVEAQPSDFGGFLHLRLKLQIAQRVRVR